MFHPYLNKIILVGTVEDYPEIVPSNKEGVYYMKLYIRTKIPWSKDEKNNVRFWEDVHYVKIYGSFERLSRLSNYIQKGTRVYVEGRMHYIVYTDESGK